MPDSKGFAPIIILLVIAILLSSGAFYAGKISSKANPDKSSNIDIEQELKPKLGKIVSQLPKPPEPPNDQASIDKQMQEDANRRERLTLKSTVDLPSIASASVDYAIKKGFKNPGVTFTSNDGEYATVSLGEATGGGGGLLFLVKRQNKWITLTYGNGYPSCSEVLPLRKKYALKKDFLLCAEELP